MLPQEKSEAVTRALRDAFGVTAIEDIGVMTRGLSSALVFRIVVRGSPFVLKIIPRVNEMNDPGRQFKHMQAAAEAGLAPHVWYSSIEDGISITDFVEPAPFPLAEALVRMPRALRMLHSLPPFPKSLNYATMETGIIRKFRAGNILSRDETKEIFAGYAQVAAVYPRLDSDMVSCHNDLKPENILFDGHRVWLVNWEASLRNDRYFDLAIVANFVVASDAEERAYLQEYFEQPPDEYQLARFFLMRQVLHLLYAAVFLLLGSSGNPVVPGEDPPKFRDFHKRVWAGEVNLADNTMKIVYGRIHWQQLRQNLGLPRFSQALRTVSDRHAHSESAPLLLPKRAESG